MSAKELVYFKLALPQTTGACVKSALPELREACRVDAQSSQLACFGTS